MADLDTFEELERRLYDLRDTSEKWARLEEAFLKSKERYTRAAARAEKLTTEIEDRKQAENALHRELEINKAVADISRELLSEDYDIARVATVTLKYAQQLTDSRHGFVSAIDPETLENVGHTMTDMLGDQCRVKDRRIAFPIGADGKYGTLWGVALNTKEPFFTNSPAGHPSSGELPAGHIPINNFLAVPVKMREQLVGLIALANADRDYTNKDIKSAERLSEIYALALHRYRYETERENLEKQLRHLQKMEAIGALAGGIAHDFNNILFPIVGFAEMLEDDLPEGSPQHECVSEIITGTKRARDLVKQILSFSRQVETEVKPVSPRIILKEVIKLIRATIPTTIEIRQDIDPSGHLIMADPTQIHQIAMNLITNAYHAMGDSGGTLSVSLKNVDMAQATEGATILKAGPHVQLTISDTGTGMDEATAAKIFDPYFTTKSKDRGTGLGLSVVHGIVQSYGGEIKVRSQPDRGTTFDIYLPAVRMKSDAGKHRLPRVLPTGDERILLVDDEEQVLRLVKKMLQRLGYHVDALTSSPDALETVKSRPDAYDLVITDMTMPHLTGDKLARKIMTVAPGMPVMICTGFSELITPQLAESIGIKGYLMKPVVQSVMARSVRKVLDEAQTP